VKKADQINKLKEAIQFKEQVIDEVTTLVSIRCALRFMDANSITQ
jgi:hypothetical protein